MTHGPGDQIMESVMREYPVKEQGFEARAKDVIAQIEHGDSAHRAWLYEHSTPIIAHALRAAVLAEREACANECDSIATRYAGEMGQSFFNGATRSAAAIRARDGGGK